MRHWLKIGPILGLLVTLVGVYSGVVTIFGSVYGQMTANDHLRCVGGVVGAAFLVASAVSFVRRVVDFGTQALPKLPSDEVQRARKFMAGATDFAVSDGHPTKVAIGAAAIEANTAESLQVRLNDFHVQLDQFADNAVHEMEFDRASIEQLYSLLQRVVDHLTLELSEKSRLKLLSGNTPDSERWKNEVDHRIAVARKAVKDALQSSLDPILKDYRDAEANTDKGTKAERQKAVESIKKAAEKNLKDLAHKVLVSNTEQLKPAIVSVDELITKSQDRLRVLIK